MVTADHGNAEKMIAPDGGKHTAHTCYPVPFTCSSHKYRFKKVNILNIPIFLFFSLAIVRRLFATLLPQYFT